MKACEDQLGIPTIRLSVRLSNEGAVRLYQHLGYQSVGIWPHYYLDGEDAVVMEKQRP